MTADEHRLHVDVTERLAATPGQPSRLEVRVRNDAPEARSVVVSVLGVDPGWLRLSSRPEPVEPGAELTVSVDVTPPVGCPAGAYPFVVVVQPLAATTGKPAGTPLQHDSRVVVGDTSRLGLALRPAEPEATRSRRFRVVLDNRGREPVQVDLAATGSPGLHVRLREQRVDLPAGATTEVKGRLTVQRKLVGQSRRLPFVVSAQGRSTPLRLDGVFVARPLLRGGVTRAIALVVVLALWASAAAVGIAKISGKAHQKPATATAAGAAADAGGASGSGGHGGAAGAGAGGGGGSAGSGSAGGQSGGSGTAGKAGGAGGSADQAGRLAGVVTGTSPAGVTVTLAPTSLVDEKAEGATFVGTPAPKAAVGKVPASLVAYATASPLSSTRSTITQADGSWAFAGVQSPGYYLLTFSKPGYQTVRYVVSEQPGTDPQPLKVGLTAGRGHLAGQVVGPHGPVGGADLTITDGTVTVATSTPTTGKVGTFDVDGLSTPGTYLVQASRNGFATASTLVTLPAGGSKDGVTITLSPGVESLVGTVTAPDDTGDVQGLGGATVTATDGKTTRTATTVTTGPVGSYTLPDLPVPSTYTVTISGPGFAPRTQKVTLDGKASSVRADAQLSPDTGTVVGTVTDSAGAGIVGAGLVLSNDNATFKTTTVSDPPGGFRVTGVAPGHYVLTGERFGKLTQYAAVDVTMGAPAQVSLKLPDAPGDGLPATAHIRGRVVDARSGGVITCPADMVTKDSPCVITVSTVDRRSDGDKRFEVTGGPDVEYTLPATTGQSPDGLLPGLHTVTVSAPGYESATVQVQVASGKVVDAPTVALWPLSGITGTISAAVDTLPTAKKTCVVAVELGTDKPPATVDCTPASTGTCTTTTVKDATCAVVDDRGHYTLDHLKHATYAVYVVPTDPEWVPVPPATIEVKQGEEQRYDATVNRLGRLVVTVQQPNDAGNPTAASGVPVTVVPSGSKAATPQPCLDATDCKTDSNGAVTATQLKTGAYDVSAGDSSTVGTASANGVPVDLNQTAHVTLVLLQDQAPVFQGQLVTSYNGGNAIDFSGAEITLTGIVGYDGANPRKQQAQVHPDTAGCFAFGATKPADGGGCTYTDSNFAKISLRVARVDLTVEAPGFGKTVDAGISVPNGSVTKVSLTPQSRSVSGDSKLSTDDSLASAGRLTLSDATVRVTTNAPGAGAVVITSDDSGTLTWTDPTLSGSDQVYPGVYQIEASLPGYDTVRTTFTCAFDPAATGGCTLPALTLLAHKGLTVEAVDDSNKGIPDAVYILSGARTPAISLAAAPGATSVTFPDLSRADAPYTVEVHAAGYQTTTAGVAEGDLTAGHPLSVTLPKLGTISGTISGAATSGGQKYPLAGATVTVACDPASAATCGSDSFQAVTDGEGRYSVTGTTQVEGLKDGTWTVTVSAPGYQTPASPLSVSLPDSAADSHDVTLVAQPVAFTLNVLDESGAALSGVDVSLTGPGCTTLCAGMEGPPGVFTFSALPPAQYSLEVSRSGYAPLNTLVNLQVGDDNQTLSVTMATRPNRISVQVSGQTGASTPRPLTAADKVNVVVAGPGGSSPVATTSSGGSSWEFDDVLDGPSTVTVSADGYGTQTRQVTLKGGQVASISITLQAATWQLTVTVKSDTGEDMSGALVSLIADSPGAQGQAAQPVSDPGTGTYTTTFNQVVPGDYTVRSSGPGEHLSGESKITVGAANANVTITVHEVHLSVGVNTSDGAAVTASIAILPKSGGGPTYSGSVTTDSADTFDVYAPAGSYVATISAPDHDSQTAALPLVGGSITLNAAAETYSLDVHVVDANGKSVSGVTVALVGGTTTVTDSKGVAGFSGLPAGKYTVAVGAPYELAKQTSVTVPATSGKVDVTVTSPSPSPSPSPSVTPTASVSPSATASP